MGKRNEDGTWKDSCLEKLHPGEPFFVLRGQDRLAPMMVSLWTALAQLHGMNREKINEALDTAAAMENWPKRKYPD